jgi:hypothetical protein
MLLVSTFPCCSYPFGRASVDIIHRIRELSLMIGDAEKNEK